MQDRKRVGIIFFRAKHAVAKRGSILFHAIDAAAVVILGSRVAHSWHHELQCAKCQARLENSLDSALLEYGCVFNCVSITQIRVQSEPQSAPEGSPIGLPITGLLAEFFWKDLPTN